MNPLPELQEAAIDPAEVDQLLPSAHLVLRCYPGSSAYELGIRQGWRLLWHADTAPSEAAIRNAREGRPTSFAFIDEDGGRYFELIDAPWPFGMITVPLPGPKLIRRLSIGDFDPEQLLDYWKDGLLSPLAKFDKPLESLMSRGFTGALYRMVGKVAPPKHIAGIGYYPVLLLLSLAKLAKGSMEEARYYLDATSNAMEASGQESFSTVHMSLCNYIASVIAEDDGDKEQALERATAAREQAPDIWEVERHLAQLEGRQPSLQTPPWTLETFPMDYRLEAHDPIGAVRNNVNHVEFGAVTDRLKDGEMLAILVMGPYRANYYYNTDLERLAFLNRALPGRIREVHVIVSGDYVSDEEHRYHSELDARRLGLPFAILWDPDQWVASRVEASGFPDRFLVDRNQRVLATERLMHEEGFWKAIQRMSEL